MLDICLLGTSGMMPLPGRWLTSMLARYNGSSLLIDCGEGTQIALRKAGFSAYPIDIICFTHFHADHISGLPGMLLSMGNAERTAPVTLIGPKGLKNVVRSLCIIASDLPFELNFIELDSNEQEIDINGYHIKAFKVNHNVICYGYRLDIKRIGKFDIDAAMEKQIPLKCWNRLQHGETVTSDGVTYTPDMVMGPERKGIRVTYCTDSRPTRSIVENAAGSDLFICEGMYAEAEKAESAKKKKHMTFYEAARMAKEASVDQMWLTHFSPSLVNPGAYMKDVRKIFPEASLGKDGRFIELNFKEDTDQ